MRQNNCELIRRELDELMLDEACSASAVQHLKECSSCREFHETQTKLRRMVGGLGTVAAPADFDFRLRARLANDTSAINYWPMMQRGLAVAGLLIVLAFGVVVVRNVVNEPKQTVVQTNPAPAQQQSPTQVQTTQPNTPAEPQGLRAQVPVSSSDTNRSERRVQTAPKAKRQLAAMDFSKQRAEVMSADPFAGDVTTVFPIDTSLQPFKLSVDDGRGNAKTISVPTVRFGSQRIVPNGNKFAQKGVW